MFPLNNPLMAHLFDMKLISFPCYCAKCSVIAKFLILYLSTVIFHFIIYQSFIFAGLGMGELEIDKHVQYILAVEKVCNCYSTCNVV